MLKVGLTGGIGSGKTTVSNLFKTLGISIIDTDVISHDLLENKPDITLEIVERFGKKNVTTNGVLDRKKLASIAFENAPKKHALENILHPAIRREVELKIQKIDALPASPKYIILVIPLLFETDFQDLVDRTLVVIADETTRIARVSKRDNRSIDEIRAIIAHQVDDRVRRIGADDIIINNDDIAALMPQINELHTKYSHPAESYR